MLRSVRVAGDHADHILLQSALVKSLGVKKEPNISTDIGHAASTRIPDHHYPAPTAPPPPVTNTPPLFESSPTFRVVGKLPLAIAAPFRTAVIKTTVQHRPEVSRAANARHNYAQNMSAASFVMIPALEFLMNVRSLLVALAAAPRLRLPP